MEAKIFLFSCYKIEKESQIYGEICNNFGIPQVINLNYPDKETKSEYIKSILNKSNMNLPQDFIDFIIRNKKIRTFVDIKEILTSYFLINKDKKIFQKFKDRKEILDYILDKCFLHSQ